MPLVEFITAAGPVAITPAWVTRVRRGLHGALIEIQRPAGSPLPPVEHVQESYEAAVARLRGEGWAGDRPEPRRAARPGGPEVVGTTRTGT